MPSITVKNIPDHTYKLLKLAAAKHYRSINSEMICLIEKDNLKQIVSSGATSCNCKTIYRKNKKIPS